MAAGSPRQGTGAFDSKVSALNAPRLLVRFNRTSSSAGLLGAAGSDHNSIPGIEGTDCGGAPRWVPAGDAGAVGTGKSRDPSGSGSGSVGSTLERR
mmetsp:Transcript_26164/g.66695  ORF Transcript_26164/g.66695 Transcript_26164/m.66695 type:complete len:96 (-) Transcript_26164:135-422(-)